jgi:hypothetical protein
MSLPVVAIFGKTGIELRSPGPDNSEETRELRCVCFATDAELEAILLRERPHVLVSFGRPEDFPLLLAAPFDVRRRWINFAPDIDLDEVGRAAYHCFLHSAVERPQTRRLSASLPRPTALASGSNGRCVRCLNKAIPIGNG